jgi:hypothetical protein
MRAPPPDREGTRPGVTLPPWPDQPEADAAAPTPPRIEITIGRIEVRAAPPAPAPAARQRGRPKLTLDAYVERRNQRE